MLNTCELLFRFEKEMISIFVKHRRAKTVQHNAIVILLMKGNKTA